MKKEKQIKEMEQYLKKNASKLIETDDDLDLFVSAAKEDVNERRQRALELQKLRKEKLQMTQGELAKAVGANIRTLQSWERGRQAYPKSVEILMELMNEIPLVRKKLILKKKAA